MSYRKCEPLVAGGLQQLRKLSFERPGSAGIRVEKDVPAGVGDGVSGCGQRGDRLVVSPAVDEKQRWIFRKDIHQPAHFPAALRQQAAHVVVDARHGRVLGEFVAHPLLELVLGHVQRQFVRLSRMPVLQRLHGQVKHDFVAVSGSLRREFGAKGGIRKDTDGNVGIEMDGGVAPELAVADIIDDDCNFASLRRMEKNAGDQRQNPASRFQKVSGLAADQRRIHRQKDGDRSRRPIFSAGMTLLFLGLFQQHHPLEQVQRLVEHEVFLVQRFAVLAGIAL